MIKSTSEADIVVAKALRYMLKVTNICPKTSTVSEAFRNSENVSFRTFFKRAVQLFFRNSTVSEQKWEDVRLEQKIGHGFVC